MVKFIKKQGTAVEFDSKKINRAINKAMKSGSGVYYPKISALIAEEAEEKFHKKETVTYKEVDKFILNKLVDYGQSLTANAYERYKTVKAYQMIDNDMDEEIYGIINGTNEGVINENSNKDAQLLSTQRDLLAGSYSRDYSNRKILPTHILNAHSEGLIHVHDTDYLIQPGSFNCDLMSLKDMLLNGTVINGYKIYPPKSFQTACTVATQISLHFANGQHGGQTFSTSHLAPFVRVSYNKWRKKYIEEIGHIADDELIEKIVQKRVREEISSGVQTIQFQENTFSSANGQTPFVSIFMYISEDKEYEKENVMIIEEILRQRYEGIENEYGVKVTPAFPKLLYVLDENNVPNNSEYRYLTDMAVKCSAKRMNPDYISAKIMKEQFDGQVFPCMGCVDGANVITYKFREKLYVESFARMWDRFSKEFEVRHQYSEDNPNLYIDLSGVLIYDTNNGFVNTKRIIRNISNNWVKVKMNNGRVLTCTEDHPLPTQRGRIFAKDLRNGDKIQIIHNQYTEEGIYNWDEDLAWAYGCMVCDGSLASTPGASFAIDGEDDIIERLSKTIDKVYNIKTRIKEQHRGEKGNYKDLGFSSRKLQYDMITLFGGVEKVARHVPNEIFSMRHNVRVAFLAGMIDADGHINDNSTITHVQIGSTNKELAIQQMLLAQSIGLKASIYENHYDGKDNTKIRYRIEFVPSEELINALACEKKRKKFANTERSNYSIAVEDYSIVQEVLTMQMEDFSYDVTTDSDYFDVSGIHSHNCRSFLSPWKDENRNYKFYGRFNRGVVTINLVDAALSANGDEDKFWGILDERLELCKEALLIKDSRLRNVSTNVSPVHWQYGGLTRLGKDDTFDKYLDNGYSSISLGYVGVYEMTMAIKGVSHTDPVGKEFALKVMKHLEDKTLEWRSIQGLHGCSLYGTPAESLGYKFAKKTEKRFGTICGITDKEWFTNSYHVCVTEPIDAFSKLKFESEFQKMSKGGAVSYVEVPNMDNNLEALAQIVDFMYENIQYAEINTKNGDSCGTCGFEGEMAFDENGEWYCPKCGERDHNKITVTRRTCGYIGSTFWNRGKSQEIQHRVEHI